MNLLRLDPIVERLRSACTPSVLRSVGSAADLAAAVNAAAGVGCHAFVLLMGAEAEEVREGSGPLRQSFVVTVSTILRVGLSGAQGAAGLKLLEEPAAAVRATLFGWQHPDAELRFSSAGEGMEDFDPKTGVSHYRLDWTTRVRLLENLT